MTTDPKVNGGPNRESTFRALAALTQPDDGQPGLPVPDVTSFRPTALYLECYTLNAAAAWASKLDLTARRIRHIPVPDDGVAYSQWFGTWRGWLVYLHAVESPEVLAAALQTEAETSSVPTGGTP